MGEDFTSEDIFLWAIFREEGDSEDIFFPIIKLI